MQKIEDSEFLADIYERFMKIIMEIHGQMSDGIIPLAAIVGRFNQGVPVEHAESFDFVRWLLVDSGIPVCGKGENLGVPLGKLCPIIKARLLAKKNNRKKASRGLSRRMKMARTARNANTGQLSL
jgi:hypothetical protein